MQKTKEIKKALEQNDYVIREFYRSFLDKLKKIKDEKFPQYQNRKKFSARKN